MEAHFNLANILLTKKDGQCIPKQECRGGWKWGVWVGYLLNGGPVQLSSSVGKNLNGFSILFLNMHSISISYTLSS